MPYRGRLGTLKTLSCPWRWVPDRRSKFWKLDNCPLITCIYSWNIAECDVKPQTTIQLKRKSCNNSMSFKIVVSFWSYFGTSGSILDEYILVVTLVPLRTRYCTTASSALEILHTLPSIRNHSSCGCLPVFPYYLNLN